MIQLREKQNNDSLIKSSRVPMNCQKLNNSCQFYIKKSREKSVVFLTELSELRIRKKKYFHVKKANHFDPSLCNS